MAPLRGVYAKPLAPYPVEIPPETVADGFVAVTWRAERIQLTKNPAFAGFCVCLRDVVEHLRTIALVPGEDPNRRHNSLIHLAKNGDPAKLGPELVPAAKAYGQAPTNSTPASMQAVTLPDPRIDPFRHFVVNPCGQRRVCALAGCAKRDGPRKLASLNSGVYRRLR